MVENLAAQQIPLVEQVRGRARRAALAENIRLERATTARWVLGDATLDIDTYHDWRASDRTLVENDRVVDVNRIRNSLRNLDALLIARERTKDVRPAIRAALRNLMISDRIARPAKMVMTEVHGMALLMAEENVRAMRRMPSRGLIRDLALGITPTLVFSALSLLGVPSVATVVGDVGVTGILLARQRMSERQTRRRHAIHVLQEEVLAAQNASATATRDRDRHLRAIRQFAERT
jgi:hypothetical protein